MPVLVGVSSPRVFPVELLLPLEGWVSSWGDQRCDLVLLLGCAMFWEYTLAQGSSAARWGNVPHFCGDVEQELRILPLPLRILSFPVPASPHQLTLLALLHQQ